ncbi:TRAP transporter small permease subunit [Billgrantia aerodenitrificans]|jgi:TRAP-type mannitol/chloroaromatic compound transport system permease small subunit|uniref:TRAP transporter small permease protein n=1 Tax=Billgrantia aerodenitrificans TaxID=2733483 RepID=A0ABS9AMB0_9GAMM|nr:TRAP transporter small permease subunit [Halomonas aerodenitrificans]MCE8022940.1 TRAP transporter small permease subunit [Halomonas aerodenitrificans]
MLRLCTWLERALERITGLAGFIGCLSMLIMIALIFGNMLSRYAFGLGAVWAQELEWYLLSVMAMMGIAYAMKFDDHVRVDILSSRFSPVGMLWLNLIAALLVALPCALLIIHYSLPFAETSFIRGERSPNSSGLPWRWIPKAMVVVGFVFVAAESLRQALENGRRLVQHYTGRA